MTFKEFNDLVGKNKPWGPASQLKEWQRVLYDKAYAMIDRCYNQSCRSYGNYGAIGTYVKFNKFSEYVRALRKDPNWSQFVKFPHDFVVDKDEKCMRMNINPRYYGPDTVQLTTQRHNSQLAAVTLSQPQIPVCWFNGNIYFSYEDAAHDACCPVHIFIDHARGSYEIDGSLYEFPHKWFNKCIREECEAYEWTKENIEKYDLTRI